MTLGGEDHGIIRVAVAPVRDAPSHRAQRVTDWVLGEVVRIIDEADGWALTAGPDGYEGWVPAAPLRRVDAAAAASWAARAVLFSTGVGVSGPLRRLPWGARLGRPETEETGVLTPEGRVVSPSQPERIVEVPASPGPRKAAVEQVTACALEWLGVPYVWGGRTELGVDCSGFVQALMARVGVALPRDSRDQREAAAEVDVAEPGDLLFFDPEGRGITHTALSLGGSRILHCASSNGRVAEDDLDLPGPLTERLAGSVVARTRPLAETCA